MEPYCYTAISPRYVCGIIRTFAIGLSSEGVDECTPCLNSWDIIRALDAKELYRHEFLEFTFIVQGVVSTLHKPATEP